MFFNGPAFYARQYGVDVTPNNSFYEVFFSLLCSLFIEIFSYECGNTRLFLIGEERVFIYVVCVACGL